MFSFLKRNKAKKKAKSPIPRTTECTWKLPERRKRNKKLQTIAFPSLGDLPIELVNVIFWFLSPSDLAKGNHLPPPLLGVPHSLDSARGVHFVGRSRDIGYYLGADLSQSSWWRWSGHWSSGSSFTLGMVHWSWCFFWRPSTRAWIPIWSTYQSMVPWDQIRIYYGQQQILPSYPLPSIVYL